MKDKKKPASPNGPPPEETADQDPLEEEEWQFEPAEEEETAVASQKQVRKLREKIKSLQEAKKNYAEEIQRQKAEFLNARKRDEARKKEETRLANERLIGDLLPVVDSFEMAFADQQAYAETPENWRKGVEYIYSQLLSTLKDYGVEQIDPARGAPFDPQYQEALEQVDADDPDQDGAVVETIQKGYSLHGQVIRSAKVKVGRYQPAPGEGLKSD